MILRKRSLVILALFVVAMLVALWVIVQALSPAVDGRQRTVTADFTDASGLTVGNDVRQLGVRVGRCRRSSCTTTSPACGSHCRTR